MNVQRHFHNAILNISTKESEYAFWQEYAKGYTRFWICMGMLLNSAWICLGMPEAETKIAVQAN